MLNMNEPLVSILMNCYNGENYLQEAINSVLDQSYQNWELFFWDNRSTDRSADIFKEYKDMLAEFGQYEKSDFEEASNLELEWDQSTRKQWHSWMRHRPGAPISCNLGPMEKQSRRLEIGK